LQPGGIVRIGVPDAGRALLGYAAGAPQQQRHPAHAPWISTRMESINFLFRQNYAYGKHQHRMAYDLETLANLLQSVGFTEIGQSPFDRLLDSPAREEGTLYVEARKPLTMNDSYTSASHDARS
jgi:predicted SAM-dependent methyltransferase